MHNTEVYTSKDKAEVLNTYFSKCLNHSVPPLSFADLDDLQPADDEQIVCTVEEVQQYFWYLKSYIGLDGISAI